MMRKRALGELEPFLDFAVAESWKLLQLFARGWVDRRDWHLSEHRHFACAANGHSVLRFRFSPESLRG